MRCAAPSAGTAPITGSTPSMRTGGSSARSGRPAMPISRQRSRRGQLRMLEEARRPSSSARTRCRPLRAARSTSAVGQAARIADSIAACERGAMLRRAAGWCGSARRRASSGRSEHVGAEARPLARVLDRRGRPARRRRRGTGRTGAIDAWFGAAARRRRAAVRRVVRRRAHPLAERVEERHVERRAVAGRARARAARSGCPSTAYMPAAMSATEMPTLLGVGLGAGDRDAGRPRSAPAGRTPSCSAYGPDDAVARHRADDEARMASRAASAATCRADRRRRAPGSARRRRRARAGGRARPAPSGRFRSSVSDSFDRFSQTK